MNIEQRARESQTLSPHLRQRVAFIAALVPDPQNVNWEAIADTWDELSRETRGTEYERTVQSLHDLIERQDADSLAHRISLLLRQG